MGNYFRNSTFSMKVTVISIFVLLSTLTVTLALSLHYYFSQSLAKDAAASTFNRTASSFSEKISSVDSQSTGLTKLLSQFPGIDQEISAEFLHPATHVMAEVLLEQDHLFAIYIGYGNGDFYELINLNGGVKFRDKLNANERDRWLVIKIYDSYEGRKRTSEYYDKNFILTRQHSEQSDYHANVRPWFKQAIESNESIRTAPYLFNKLQTSGVTYAKRIRETNAVLAVDMSLKTLSEFLASNRVLENGQAILFNADGQITAHSYDVKTDAKLPIKTKPIKLTEEEKQYISSLDKLRVSNELNWPPFDFSYSGQPQGYSIDFVNLLAQKLGLTIEYSNGYSWDDLTSLFQNNKLDILHSVFPTESRKNWGLFSDPYLRLPSVIVTNSSEPEISTLNQLEGKVLAVPSGWSLVEILRQNRPGIKLLEVKDSLEALKAVLNGEATASLETKQVVQYLLDVYSLDTLKIHTTVKEMDEFANQELAIMVHEHNAPLRDLLNKAIRSISNDEKEFLDRRWTQSNDENSILRTVKAGVVPFVQFVKMAKQSDTQDFVLETHSHHGIEYTLFVKLLEANIGSQNYVGFLIPTKELQAPYMDKVNTSTIITLGAMAMLSPLLIYFSNIIVMPVKELALENNKIQLRNFKNVQPVKSRIKEMVQLSDSMFSMATSIEQYQKNQQELMDSFIKLIAQAIDDKSPYTAGHCERVPLLATLLADSASESLLPAYKDFQLKTEEERREFEIAAWLHDCGKVTTPEHIVDKGTKLEAIYNRIHLVRMRFEVLLRDTEINYWKGVSEGQNKSDLENIRNKQQQQIIDDFSFVAECNIGGEFMSEARIRRLQTIASQTWVRHLDDRLGLSPEEARKMEHIPAKQAPCVENLLADKREHLFDWPKDPRVNLSDDIKISVPKYQANLGELYNLSINKGTLTKEDRYRINEHVISTIKMLEALPLTDELKRVPKYAGGHHETLIGTGYPYKLTKDELPMATRILAIADVFEALTASDRPYKKAKTLSEAIRILSFMVKDEHLDKDLFELLLTSGIYLEYADYYLPKSQIDDVDITQYL